MRRILPVVLAAVLLIGAAPSKPAGNGAEPSSGPRASFIERVKTYLMVKALDFLPTSTVSSSTKITHSRPCDEGGCDIGNRRCPMTGGGTDVCICVDICQCAPPQPPPGVEYQYP